MDLMWTNWMSVDGKGRHWHTRCGPRLCFCVVQLFNSMMCCYLGCVAPLEPRIFSSRCMIPLGDGCLKNHRTLKYNHALHNIRQWNQGNILKVQFANDATHGTPNCNITVWPNIMSVLNTWTECYRLLSIQLGRWQFHKYNCDEWFTHHYSKMK